MFQIASVLPSGVVENFEAPRWILLAVCLTGVLLAYITDEGYSLIVGEEAASIPKTVPPQAQGSLSEVLTTTGISIKASLPSFVAAPVDRIIAVLIRQWARLQLYRSSIALKKLAKTKRHFFYLMEKKILNLPIKPDEDEVDSYLDCKNYLGKTWPFMWEVSNVKADKIGCAGFECIPMSSYSYLDLIRDERVQEAAITAARAWSTGNHGPRMLGGNTSILRELEGVIARYFGRDETLLCATGYLACMSACAAISGENTVIFADSRIHASLRAGLKIGDGKLILFKHNDFVDCEKKMKQWRHKFSDSWMIIESVYSMDGDICNLPAANNLCKQFNVKMVIDEAHGLGVIGKTGRGIEEHFGLQGCATLVVGTFSKSIASIGGYICGPKRFISYLDFHAPGNVFSAPLPAYCAGAAIKSFEILSTEQHIVTKAQNNAELLRAKLVSGGGYWPENYPEGEKYEVEGEVSTVLPIVFQDDIDRVMRIATSMKRKGYMCSAVAYPACPLRRPRFRITATSAYDEKLIEEFVKIFVTTCVEEKPSEFKQLI